MKVQIPAAALRASAFCMASKDIRYHLNGTLLDVTGHEEAFVVSTTGHVLFAGRVLLEYLEEPQAGGWSLIIPDEVIKKLDKKAPWFVLESLSDGRYMLDGKVFTPIDGKFPDYRRVIPDNSSQSGAAGQFNPELLGQCVKAIQTYYELTKANSNAWGFTQNGKTCSAVVHGPDNNAVAVCTPMNGGVREQEAFGTYHGLRSPSPALKKAA